LQRTLLAIGVALMLGFGALGVYGVLMNSNASRAFNANCVPPLLGGVGSWDNLCADLSAQLGQALTLAVEGGLVAVVGAMIAVLGFRRRPVA
jgi:hypothetical protein